MAYSTTTLPGQSQEVPEYLGIFAADLKDFTRLPAALHAATSQILTRLVDEALCAAGLEDVATGKLFPENRGDSVVFGFDPRHLAHFIHPGLAEIDDALARYNAGVAGPRVRARASLHVGPLPSGTTPGAGNGTPRNDVHRLLDSRPVKAALALASAHTTHLAAIISNRVFEDVVLAGYCGLHADRFTEVCAEVDGKAFTQRAWLYVPRPSGNLFSGTPDVHNPTPARQCAQTEALHCPEPTMAAGRVIQFVEKGTAIGGNVTGDVCSAINDGPFRKLAER